MKYSNYELKQISQWWFDASKLTLASMVIKFFEPEGPKISEHTFLTIIGGLFLTLGFVRFGLSAARKVEEI